MHLVITFIGTWNGDAGRGGVATPGNAAVKFTDGKQKMLADPKTIWCGWKALCLLSLACVVAAGWQRDFHTKKKYDPQACLWQHMALGRSRWQHEQHRAQLELIGFLLCVHSEHLALSIRVVPCQNIPINSQAAASRLVCITVSFNLKAMRLGGPAAGLLPFLLPWD